MTDSHAQLNPIYFREPNVNIGLGEAFGRAAPGRAQPAEANSATSIRGIEAHALTYLDFTEAAEKFGSRRRLRAPEDPGRPLRAVRGDGASLLLDGGDTWQGSGTALWTRGMDMVGACNLLGVDIMTGHWEFTYLDEEVIKQHRAPSTASSSRRTPACARRPVRVRTSAASTRTPGTPSSPTRSRRWRRRVAVIGQAFPYTPIANPQRFIPDWTFGIRGQPLQDSSIRSAPTRNRTGRPALAQRHGRGPEARRAA
jgi:sulfur-oxidizing protein SoxB